MLELRNADLEVSGIDEVGVGIVKRKGIVSSWQIIEIKEKRTLKQESHVTWSCHVVYDYRTVWL